MAGVTVDVVVRFVGGGHGEADDWVTRDLDLAVYNTIKTSRLAVFGLGVPFTDQAASRELAINTATRIQAAVKAGEERGIICIHGNSAGGRHALSLAAKLTEDKVPIAYLGLEDAAFFPYETGMRPTNGPLGLKVPLNIPRFDCPEIIADQKVNYYQTRGNWMEVTYGDILWWCSSMLGKEVHGIINGWNDSENVNLDDCVSAVATDSQKHDQAGNLGIKRSKAAISSLLKTCRP